MAMDKFKAAPLPNPPTQWDPQYMRQVIRVLELYFSQLDSNTPNHAQQYTADNFYGGVFSGYGYELILPHNQFQSQVTQTASAIDQAYALQLEVTDFADGITITSNPTGPTNTRITFSQDGIYTLNFSLSFKNTTNDAQTIDIWFRYNGTDVPNSNSRFSVPARKSTGDPSYLVAVTPYTGHATASGVYVEIMWRVSSTSVTMEALPAVTYSAGVTPAIPATPSAIVQAIFVSRAV